MKKHKNQDEDKEQSSFQAILNLVPGDQVVVSKWFGGNMALELV